MKIEYNREDLKAHFEKFYHGTGVKVNNIKTSNSGLTVYGEIESLAAVRERDLDEAGFQGEMKSKLQSVDNS